MSTGRRLRALGVAVATVLLAAGCGVAGIHPGAAAMVGGTEITIGDVDKTSRAVSDALGHDFSSTNTLAQLVDNALAAQVREEKGVTISNADIAAAAPRVVGDEATFQKFQADPVARDFLNAVAATALTQIKLGGGTLEDPALQQKQQQGAQLIKDASKNIQVDIAPRFGKWTDGAIDGTVSGSLSQESAQAKARREAQQNAQQGQG